MNPKDEAIPAEIAKKVMKERQSYRRQLLAEFVELNAKANDAMAKMMQSFREDYLDEYSDEDEDEDEHEEPETKPDGGPKLA